MTFNKKLEPVKISNHFKYWKLDNLKIEGNNDNSHNNGLPQKIVAFQKECCVDGNYNRRPNSNQAPCYVTINQHEARVNKKRPTFVDPHQQCCAVSNVSSV